MAKTLQAILCLHKILFADCKKQKNYSFEIGCLYILFYSIINPKRWFQENKNFHFLKVSENMKK